MPVPLLAMVLPVLLAAAPGAHAAPAESQAGIEGWRLPLAGPSVAGRFSFDRRRPFLAGQRRVVTLAGRPGQVVRAPCGGAVTFAGSLPGGKGVSLRCRGLSATLTGLGAVSVGRGALLVAGQPAGRLGPGGSLSLGARLVDRRNGYIDPLELVGPPSRPAPLAPPLRTGPRLRPEPRERPASRRGVPPALLLLGAAWLGLGIAGSAIGVGIALGGSGPAWWSARRARPAGR